MCKWEGTAGEDFIALQLILDWAGRIVAKGPRYSPLLDPKMTMIAISQKPHPKEVNLIQVLYVSPNAKVNNMM